MKLRTLEREEIMNQEIKTDDLLVTLRYLGISNDDVNRAYGKLRKKYPLHVCLAALRIIFKSN